MALQLYFHPLSSYCQKALIACHEYGIAFEPQQLDGPDSPAAQALARLWPVQKFPALVDGGRTIVEASCIIEHLGLGRPAAERLIPDDAQAALQVRMLDRVFDNYIATPQQKIVADALRQEGTRDPQGVADARKLLQTTYARLDGQLAGRSWAAGERFSLADCGAAPFLFYAHWAEPMPAGLGHLRSYARRLRQRPSVQRVAEAALPFLSWVPLAGPAPVDF